MIIFQETLTRWNTDDFSRAFKKEASQLTTDELLLQQALRYGSYAIKDDLKVMINSSHETDTTIVVNTGLFYNSITGGCNCADDPSPEDRLTEYSEVSFSINKLTAEVTLSPGSL